MYLCNLVFLQMKVTQIYWCINTEYTIDRTRVHNMIYFKLFTIGENSCWPKWFILSAEKKVTTAPFSPERITLRGGGVPYNAPNESPRTSIVHSINIHSDVIGVHAARWWCHCRTHIICMWLVCSFRESWGVVIYDGGRLFLGVEAAFEKFLLINIITFKLT